jgi:hypothetical protein
MLVLYGERNRGSTSSGPWIFCNAKYINRGAGAAGGGGGGDANEALLSAMDGWLFVILTSTALPPPPIACPQFVSVSTARRVYVNALYDPFKP